MPFEETESSDNSVALLKKRLSGFETEEGRLAGLSYVPNTKDEVIITTSPKAGTTWMQQICHQLRSAPKGGDMSFSEISEAVPWLELAFDQGQDVNAPQFGEEEGLPRLFKSHAWAGHCPEGCKKIVVIRHPFDVAVSFYRFFENWFFEEGTISLEEFLNDFWLARGVPASRMNNASFFVHLTSWYERREEDDILMLCFEDLKEDLRSQVQRVAQFISNEKHDFNQAEYIDLATERASFSFMKENESKFDERLSKTTRNVACGLPKDAGLQQTKLNEGKSGQGKLELSKELQDAIMKKWNDVVEPVTGCTTYEELRSKLQEESKQF